MSYPIPVGQAVACESKRALFKDPSNDTSTQWNTSNSTSRID